MKKVDYIIRSVFLFVIIELFILQILTIVQFMTTAVEYVSPALALLIINVVAYISFLLYNLLIFILHSIFQFEISKKYVLWSLLASSFIIFISFFLF